MRENIIVLDDKNELLNAWYKNDNKKILHGFSKNKKCFIFCSSNGLYFPNTEGCFFDEICMKDRYEWESVALKILPYVEKIILLRDVRKSYYVTGINEKINSIDLLINDMREETEGYDIFTVGSSAGGYLAMILGGRCEQKAVFLRAE